MRARPEKKQTQHKIGAMKWIEYRRRNDSMSLACYNRIGIIGEYCSQSERERRRERDELRRLPLFIMLMTTMPYWQQIAGDIQIKEWNAIGIAFVRWVLGACVCVCANGINCVYLNQQQQQRQRAKYSNLYASLQRSVSPIFHWFPKIKL